MIILLKKNSHQDKCTLLYKLLENGVFDIETEIYEEIRNHYINDYLKDEKHKNNLSISSKKRVSTPEGRKELLYSLECARKSKLNNKESIKKLSNSIKNSWKNDEIRRKHMESLSKISTPEFYKKRRESIKNAYKNPEALKRKSIAMKEVGSREEVRLKRSIAMKKYWNSRREKGINNEMQTSV